MTIWLNNNKNICFNKYWSPNYGLLVVMLLISLKQLTVPTIPPPWNSSPGRLTPCCTALVHCLPQPPLLYLLCLLSFTWSWSGGGYLLLSLLFSTLSLGSCLSACEFSSHSGAECRSVSLFHFWSSRIPQVIPTCIFCSLSNATNSKPNSLPSCTGAPTVVFLWSFLRYSIVSPFF